MTPDRNRSSQPSSLRQQRLDVLRRARKLPPGPDKADLRQLALGLRYLEIQGFQAKVQDRVSALEAFRNVQAEFGIEKLKPRDVRGF
jgi:hypothetical protein